MRLLRTKVRANGTWRLQLLIDELAWSDLWKLEDFALDVEEAGWTRVLCDDWVAESSPPRGSDRLANLTRKVLAACGQVTIEALAAGLERQVRFGRLPLVPPLHVLTAYLSGHADFQVIDGAVASLLPLDAEQELSPTEFIIWRRLRQTDGGPLSRNDLRIAALGAGVDLPAFASAISYSPIVESRAHGLWGLRGTGDPSTEHTQEPLEARLVRFGQIEATTARASRYTWDGQGHLVITSILFSPESTVVSIPRAVVAILDGRDFEAVGEGGQPVGTVKVRRGRSWGYDRFLASRRHQRGDVLTVTFDLSGRLCTLAATERPGGNE